MQLCFVWNSSVGSPTNDTTMSTTTTTPKRTHKKKTNKKTQIRRTKNGWYPCFELVSVVYVCVWVNRWRHWSRLSIHLQHADGATCTPVDIQTAKKLTKLLSTRNSHRFGLFAALLLCCSAALVLFSNAGKYAARGFSSETQSFARSNAPLHFIGIGVCGVCMLCACLVSMLRITHTKLCALMYYNAKWL